MLHYGRIHTLAYGRAVGKGNAPGTVRAVLDHVRADAPCPECRTPGVFVLARELRLVEQLLRKRCGTGTLCVSLRVIPCTWACSVLGRKHRVACRLADAQTPRLGLDVNSEHT